ncbi:MAG: FAD-binding oxidoreductase [bacterium LCO1.1]|uniref:FAD-binding oxidoreductase n=1 Tax=Candidatus Weimeria bifida TaxID=2599074 RepID=A0A6N7IYY5_9FIRM|nr:FAD-binding oxidoreductase [Candidatus Weimeria bifida]
MTNEKYYDIVVIGAGAIGTSVAYHLAKEGYKTALLERGDIASGSSSHCDAVAVICDKLPGLDTKMGQASIDYFGKLAKEFDYDFEYTPKGCLYVCETEPEFTAASKYCEAQQKDGYKMRMIDSRELSEMEPHISKDLYGALYTPPESSVAVNPYRLCFAFTYEAEKFGLEKYTYCKITKINLNDKTNAVESLETNYGTIHTKRIVNCAGAWAPFVGKLTGLSIPIEPRKGTNLVSEQTPRLCNNKIMEYGYMMSKFDSINFKRKVSKLVEDQNIAFNLEYTNSNNLLVGGNRLFRGYDIRTEIETVKAICERAMRFFPELANIKCIRTYSGVRPFVKDHLPIVSDVDSIPGYYIAAGHEGDGICLSPITGKFMAEIVAGRPTDFDISKLDFKRFA